MLERSSGYVVLVDIDGYTRMKILFSEDAYLRLMQSFFLICEKLIAESHNMEGGGYIIGDGAIFFFQAEDANNAFVRINEITSELKSGFHAAADLLTPGHDFTLSFAAGYCDYHVRRGVDLVGRDVDELFGLMKSAKDETVHLNERLAEQFDRMADRR